MVYKNLLRHRGIVLRLVEHQVHGMSVDDYEPVSLINVRCFVDLTFIRKGRDPQWSAEAGRPADRSGVLFLLPDQDVRSGDRFQVTKGPPGTFQVQGALDDAWAPTKLHHKEYGLIEVPSSIAGQIRG